MARKPRNPLLAMDVRKIPKGAEVIGLYSTGRGDPAKPICRRLPDNIREVDLPMVITFVDSDNRPIEDRKKED